MSHPYRTPDKELQKANYQARKAAISVTIDKQKKEKEKEKEKDFDKYMPSVNDLFKMNVPKPLNIKDIQGDEDTEMVYSSPHTMLKLEPSIEVQYQASQAVETQLKARHALLEGLVDSFFAEPNYMVTNSSLYSVEEVKKSIKSAIATTKQELSKYSMHPSEYQPVIINKLRTLNTLVNAKEEAVDREATSKYFERELKLQSQRYVETKKKLDDAAADKQNALVDLYNQGMLYSKDQLEKQGKQLYDEHTKIVNNLRQAAIEAGNAALLQQAKNYEEMIQVYKEEIATADRENDSLEKTAESLEKIIEEKTLKLEKMQKDYNAKLQQVEGELHDEKYIHEKLATKFLSEKEKLESDMAKLVDTKTKQEQLIERLKTRNDSMSKSLVDLETLREKEFLEKKSEMEGKINLLKSEHELQALNLKQQYDEALSGKQVVFEKTLEQLQSELAAKDRQLQASADVVMDSRASVAPVLVPPAPIINNVTKNFYSSARDRGSTTQLRHVGFVPSRSQQPNPLAWGQNKSTQHSFTSAYKSGLRPSTEEPSWLTYLHHTSPILMRASTAALDATALLKRGAAMVSGNVTRELLGNIPGVERLLAPGEGSVLHQRGSPISPSSFSTQLIHERTRYPSLERRKSSKKSQKRRK